MDNLFNTVLKERYVPTDVLGAGAFGTTYLAWDTVENRKTAVKVCSGDFAEEARLLKEGGHIPGLVKILDFFEENGQGFLVLEYLSGGTLKEYVKGKKQGKIKAEELTVLLKPVLEALVFMHSIGIVHCDVSPDNILLDEKGECRLIDLGAARQRSGSEEACTEEEKRLLKAAYAAPEQYEAPGLIGPWTDVYGLCAMMYELLTGEKPVPAAERIRRDTIKPPSFYEAVPAEVEHLLMHGLEMEIQKRYFSPEFLMTGLQMPLENVRVLEGAVRHYWGKLWLDISARGKRGFYIVTGKNKKRRIRKRIFAGVLAAGIFCLGIYGLLYGWKTGHQEEIFYWKLKNAGKAQVQKNDTALFTKFSKGYGDCVDYLKTHGLRDETYAGEYLEWFRMDETGYMGWKHPSNKYRKLYLDRDTLKEAFFYYTGGEDARIKREAADFYCSVSLEKSECGQMVTYGVKEDSYTVELPKQSVSTEERFKISWDPLDGRAYSVEYATEDRERAGKLLTDYLPLCCPETGLTQAEVQELLTRAAEEETVQEPELNAKSKVRVFTVTTGEHVRYYITIAAAEGCL